MFRRRNPPGDPPPGDPPRREDGTVEEPKPAQAGVTAGAEAVSSHFERPGTTSPAGLMPAPKPDDRSNSFVAAIKPMDYHPTAQPPMTPSTANPATRAEERTVRPPIIDKGPDMTPPSKPMTPTTSAFNTQIPRRVVDIPGGPPITAPSPTPIRRAEAAAQPDVRKLIVGREISLSGEIASCDVLVVEGTVEARLPDGRVMEITDTGLFKGAVEIDEADIAGRFEGELTVRGRLRVRSGGRIQGAIRYGELEVEAGGQLSGEIHMITDNPSQRRSERPAATLPAMGRAADQT